jgi:hypothetical protein
MARRGRRQCDRRRRPGRHDRRGPARSHSPGGHVRRRPRARHLPVRPGSRLLGPTADG